MENIFGLNAGQSLTKTFELQEKLVKGMEVIMDIDYSGYDLTPKELVYKEDKMSLYHYRPTTKTQCKTPALIVYALVNRQYMMDIHPDKSVIKRLLDMGLDLYIIDWGYPTAEDKYITMEDYIEGYMDSAIEYILMENNIKKLNLIGVCQGGTFSVIYSSLYPEKIKNLVTMVTPVEFDIQDGLLFKWSKYIDFDNIVDAYGIVPGSFMNSGFLILKPYSLMIDKYIGVIENMDDPESMADFMRMEKWIFDSPGQAGEAYRQFLKELFQENRLIKGNLTIGNKKANLRNITMPLLNMFAEYDHLVPPASSKPLNETVSSTDSELISYPVGHIGMFVSSRSQKEVAPKLAQWLIERSKQ